jgi:hypothetical protein
VQKLAEEHPLVVAVIVASVVAIDVRVEGRKDIRASIQKAELVVVSYSSLVAAWNSIVVRSEERDLAVRVIEEPDNVFVVVHKPDKLGELVLVFEVLIDGALFIITIGTLECMLPHIFNVGDAGLDRLPAQTESAESVFPGGDRLFTRRTALRESRSNGSSSSENEELHGARERTREL